MSSTFFNLPFLPSTTNRVLSFRISSSFGCRFVSIEPDWKKNKRKQYHTPPEMSTETLGIHDGAGTLEFNGHAEIVVPSLDVLKKLVQDNFFSEFAKPDEAALVDIGSVMRTIGYEEIHMENGKAV